MTEPYAGWLLRHKTSGDGCTPCIVCEGKVSYLVWLIQIAGRERPSFETKL